MKKISTVGAKQIRNVREQKLISFCAQSNCTDGASPYAGLVFDQKENLYGTTGYGGANCSLDFGCGVVFKLTPKGKETVRSRSGFGFGSRFRTSA